MRVIAFALLLFVAPAWAGEESAKRAELWKAFAEVTRDDVRVYAENPSLTQICYRAGGKTMLFSLKSRAVEQVMHAKQVPFVNRITYETIGNRAAYVLWYNGAEELRVGVDSD